MTHWHDDTLTRIQDMQRDATSWQDDMKTWWDVDMLTCWHVGMFTYWLINFLTCWHDNKLRWWQADKISGYAKRCRHATSWQRKRSQDDMLTCWHVDMLTDWNVDMLTCWYDDMMTWWHDDIITSWHADTMTRIQVLHFKSILNSKLRLTHWLTHKGKV